MHGEEQLKNNAGFPGFYVFFVAPQKAENGLFDDPLTDKISTKVEISYSEQTNDSIRSGKTPRFPRSSRRILNSGTEDPVNIKSAVPKNGGTFFTGTGAPRV